MLSEYNQETTVRNINPASFQALTAHTTHPIPSLHYHFALSAVGENLNAQTKESREKFYRFIAGCARARRGSVKAVSGKNNGVHLLVSLNPAQNAADFIERIKVLSAAWAKQNLKLADFSWYKAEIFTVGDSQCRHLSRRIARQSDNLYRKNIQLN